MCRLFAYISPTQEFLLEDVLVAPVHSLSRQPTKRYDTHLRRYNKDEKSIASMKERLRRNWFFSTHGMGVAWYSSTRSEYDGTLAVSRPVVYKSLTPPLADPSFRSICAGTRTKACFGHIRAVVAKQDIPTLSEYNCHPFIYGRYSFMHNGGVADFKRIKKAIMALVGREQGDWIRGDSDTETFAALFFTYLDEKQAASPEDFIQKQDRVKVLAETLMHTIAKVVEIQRDVNAGPPASSGLNLVITDGDVLVCCRFRNDRREDQKPATLFYSTTAARTLARDNDPPVDGSYIIVASEQTTHVWQEWVTIEKNHCIMFDGEKVLEPLALGDLF